MRIVIPETFNLDADTIHEIRVKVQGPGEKAFARPVPGSQCLLVFCFQIYCAKT